MARYREVKQWGNSLVIVLDRTDIKDLNVRIGDLVDIEDAIRKTSVPEELAKITDKPTKPRRKKK